MKLSVFSILSDSLEPRIQRKRSLRSDWLDCASSELSRGGKSARVIYISSNQIAQAPKVRAAANFEDQLLKALDFREATESLERSQRVRLDRVLLSWEDLCTPPFAPPAPARTGPLARFRDWLLGKTDEQTFDSFLNAAHRHEAVARRSPRGRRSWFDNWRQHALAALRLGLSAQELVELLRSAPIAAPRRGGLARPVRRAGVDFAGTRERLENVIFPNAPSGAGAFRHFATGDGLTAVPA